MHAYDTDSAEGRQEAELGQRLDALGLSLSRTRSEAIAGRETSGIENEWLEDEEHYEGIDEANRGEMAAWRSKPAGQAALRSDDDTGNEDILPDVTPWTEMHMLNCEKEVLGFYVTSNPLTKVAEKLAAFSTAHTNELASKGAGAEGEGKAETRGSGQRKGDSRRCETVHF